MLSSQARKHCLNALKQAQEATQIGQGSVSSKTKTLMRQGSVSSWRQCIYFAMKRACHLQIELFQAVGYHVRSKMVCRRTFF